MMDTDVKISVIVPAYNVAGYIQRCMDTLIDQSFHEFEVIVIDDGSTDDTPRILDEYAEQDNRIRVIHKENEGVSAARNLGIREAKGEYILFFDGDDFCDEFALIELYRFMKTMQADTILYGYRTYEGRKIKDSFMPIFNEGIYDGDDILQRLAIRFIGVSGKNVDQWLKGNRDGLYVENPALWRAMVSTSVIRENNLWFDENLKVGEDTIFMTKYLSYAKRCYVYHETYYYLVTRETSTIYQYERNPEAKLIGKKKLLDAREELTKDIMERKGFDLKPYWTGTVVMSAIELAFLLSKKNKHHKLKKRYRMFRSYLEDERVQKIIEEFYLGEDGGIRRIPFILLKKKHYALLFAATWCLNLMNYQFKR